MANPEVGRLGCVYVMASVSVGVGSPSMVCNTLPTGMFPNTKSFTTLTSEMKPKLNITCKWREEEISGKFILFL